MAHTKKMLTEDWVKVPPNPIQRDTEKHASKAKHLHTQHPTHSVVHAAELPNGKLIKLDGHTRALLWKRKEIPVPMQVTVVIYPAKDIAEVEQLYKDFDSKDALESQRDKVYGAFNRHNFEAQSPLLQSGGVTYALRIAYGVLLGGNVKSSSGANATKDRPESVRSKANKIDVYGMIDEFSYELHALDGFGLAQGEVSSGIMAAFVISYRRHGHKITPFWTGVFGGKGSKIDGQMDAIQATLELVLSRKGSYGAKAATDIAARALKAVEAWLKEEMFYRVPTPLDTNRYLVGYERPTERLIKGKDIERARIERERAPAKV